MILEKYGKTSWVSFCPKQLWSIIFESTAPKIRTKIIRLKGWLTCCTGSPLVAAAGAICHVWACRGHPKLGVFEGWGCHRERWAKCEVERLRKKVKFFRGYVKVQGCRKVSTVFYGGIEFRPQGRNTGKPQYPRKSKSTELTRITLKTILCLVLDFQGIGYDWL